MELEEYEVMYRVENSHWWYQGMKSITLGLLDKYVGRGKDLKILDAGCGTGAVMQYVEPFGTVTGVDFSPAALEFCRQRGAGDLVESSILEMPFEDASFDLITSFDVLSECGLQKDEIGMREFFRVLRPGGQLLLRLPAYRWLRGKHDEQVHTRHRFSKGELLAKLRKAGYAIEHASYANTTLFPVAVLKRMSERVFPPKQKGSDLTISTGVTNTLFKGLLTAEGPVVRSIGLPFGLTVISLARKPG